ncbi:MAG: hypothetical protein ACYC6L_05115 [Anaerolineae bacterium]
MSTVADKLWLWCHQEGSHNYIKQIGAESSITPAEALVNMGIPNAVMVTFAGLPEPPLLPHALKLANAQRLVWSIVGDSSSKRNDTSSDLEEVIGLAPQCPNLCGAIMDDFFHKPDASGAVSRYSAAQLAWFADRLHTAIRPLDLWVVLYGHDLDLPVAPLLAPCDVVTFWTWKAAELPNLKRNLARARALAPGKRLIQGCYMWDYGAGKEMSVENMRWQCEQGLEMLKSGEIDGLIMLASCICDLDLHAVRWTREWIGQVSHITLT